MSVLVWFNNPIQPICEELIDITLCHFSEDKSVLGEHDMTLYNKLK